MSLWHARPVRPLRVVRAALVPLAIGLPPLFWVMEATRRASLAPLGRDQGIFQYVAWALGHGAVDYRDVRDVNGPLTHLVHVVFLALGGADEHRFHVLDLAVTGLSFAAVGACLPGLRTTRAPAPLERAAWAFAAWVVLSGQYLLFDFWEMAQRESFFDWFMLPAASLQLVAQAPWGVHRGPHGRARQARSFALAGALGVVPWFGKPTYVLFTIAQLAALVLDDGLEEPFLPRSRALRAFGAGALAAAAGMTVLLFVYGDAAAFAHIQWADVPAMYRYIWPRSPGDMFSEPWRATQAVFALTGAVVLVALIVLGEMPRRALVIALLPVAALSGVVVQAKGFPYHFHPVTAGVHLQWLAFAAWLSERTRVAQRRLALVRTAPLAIAAVIAFRVATAMQDSPHIRATWLLWSAQTSEERETAEYFDHFARPDFFPFEMREAAAYLRDHTGPDERVQTYGMDAYLLFLARRASATPYIYAYDLNADAALQGGTGGAPDEEQSGRIRRIRDRHEDDLLARLQARPPAAFVFMDGVPLLTEADAWRDFEVHCERAAPWVRERYRETARFGHDHVWMRLDLAPDEPAGTDVTRPLRTH
jgi:hypothetical protein